MVYATNRLAETKKVLVEKLSGIYPRKEAENLMNMLIMHYFGLSRAMQQVQIERRLSGSEMPVMQGAVKRLLNSEPIQYVLGVTEFYGLQIAVGQNVLIPRPETEELVGKIIGGNSGTNLEILDIGTGSGCIALALKEALPMCSITAIDVSVGALSLARKNAKKLNLDIDFRQCNILNTEACWSTLGKSFHIIVSNPPYVLQKEKKRMADNVLKYEPHLALFVEDTDPLLFYREIMDFARKALKPGGKLYLEINANYAVETASLFGKDIFNSPEILTDLHGKSRFLIVRKH